MENWPYEHRKETKLPYIQKQTTLIRMTKDNYFIKQIEANKSSKNLWQTINKITKTSNRKSEIKHPEGRLATAATDIANILNTHYIN